MSCGRRVGKGVRVTETLLYPSWMCSVSVCRICDKIETVRSLLYDYLSREVLVLIGKILILCQFHTCVHWSYTPPTCHHDPNMFPSHLYALSFFIKQSNNNKISLSPGSATDWTVDWSCCAGNQIIMIAVRSWIEQPCHAQHAASHRFHPILQLVHSFSPFLTVLRECGRTTEKLSHLST